MKKKLLITGASGFLGYHLLRIFSPDREVYGIVHSHEINYPSATSIQCDISNYIELGNYMEDIEPDAVIHAAAISNTSFCQNNKEISYAINVEATKNLAGICSDFNIPFAFTSTDLVFDGKKGMYAEEDAKNPLNVYGEHKAIAEDEVLSIYPEATVFRLPLMFGFPEASASNFMQSFITQIRNGSTYNLFTDEYRSACGAKSIALGIKLLFETNSGIIHLAGRERISRYDFGLKIVNSFGLSSEKIHMCSQKDVKTGAPRAADVSLNISKALSLGYSPLTLDKELELISQGKYFV